MGEYEDRYPDAYGRGDETAQGQDGRNVQPIAPVPEAPPRERFALRRRLGGDNLQHRERREAWEHARSATAPASGEPAPRPIRMVEPTPQATVANYRGVGPRGYARSPARIYEDVCDRLTDDPQIDASDVEVRITGVEITLAGTVDSADTAARAQALAGAVPGVRGIRNALTVRPPATATR